MQGLQLIGANVDKPGNESAVRAFAGEQKLSFLILLASEDMAGIYNVLFRYLSDRRRDLGIPTSFLIDENGFIVKVYQGPFEPKTLQADWDRMTNHS
jgi:peroxiredoxin